MSRRWAFGRRRERGQTIGDVAPEAVTTGQHHGQKKNISVSSDFYLTFIKTAASANVLKAEAKHLNNVIRALEARLRTSKEEANQRVNQLVSEQQLILQDFENQVRRRERCLHIAQDATDRLRASTGVVINQLREENRKLLECKEEANRLRPAIEELRDQNREKDRQLQDTKSRLDEAELEAHCYEHELRLAREQLAELREENERLQVYEDEANQLRPAIGELRDQNREKDRQLQDTKTKLGGAESRARSNARKLRYAMDQLAKAQEERRNRQAQQEEKEDEALALSRSFEEAVIAGDVQRTEELLDQGADINALLQYPGVERDECCHINAIGIAAMRNDEKMMKLLLRPVGDINRTFCAYGFTAIRQAAVTGNRSAVKMLLDCGADPQKGCFTALHDACYNGHLEVAKFLLDSGLDANHRTGPLPEGRWTWAAWPNTAPIHSALAKSGQASILRLLIERGADVNATVDDGSGSTPLHLLDKKISVDSFHGYELSESSAPLLARMLLKNGANVRAKNRAGRSFIDALRDLRTKSRESDITSSSKHWLQNYRQAFFEADSDTEHLLVDIICEDIPGNRLKIDSWDGLFVGL